MLLDVLLTKHCWLMTSVPQVLHSHYGWNRWFNELTSHDLAKFMNDANEIEFSISMIEDELDNYSSDSEEFDCLLIIHSHLINLLFLVKDN